MSNEQKKEPKDLPPPMAEWLESQPEQDRQELERMWELAGEAAPEEPAPEETRAAWRELEDELDAEDTRGRSPAGNVFRLRRTLVAAAIATALVLGGYYFWQRPVQVVASPGEMTQVTLPDGSRVELNSASRLTYERALFGWDREVTLEGEAFFEVAPGEEPFTVRTFNAAVQVLGTRFNVRAREDEPERSTTVAVEEGKVAFAAEGLPDQPITLTAGQASRVAGEDDVPTPPEPVSAGRAAAWRAGGLYVRGEPLSVLARELERRYGVEVRIQGEKLRRDTISLYLPEPKSAEAVLGDLCSYVGCTAKRSGRGFTLHPDN